MNNINFIARMLKAAVVSGVFALVLLSGTARAAEESPLTQYYGNTLLCQNQTSKAVCHLWLNEDGSYFLLYDRGVQPDVPVAGGNFRVEGRRGKYKLQGKAGAYQVCLTPDAVKAKTFKIEEAKEIYGGKACYALPEHKVGEKWTQAGDGGQQYKMWLVKGHG